ncbi:hypothetical protein K438DRAFT_1779589 [Mycena galopus ATCC 62051]|nr:hypothetical protein K438DRAFT_1779589 [Mycena galopus ATCC 62051]
MGSEMEVDGDAVKQSCISGGCDIPASFISDLLCSKDWMGNTEILKQGNLQLTSGGPAFHTPRRRTGPVRSTSSRSDPCPLSSDSSPNISRDISLDVYASVDAETVEKDSREGTGPAPRQSPLTLDTRLLTDGESLKQTIKGAKVYIHVIQTRKYNTWAATGATIQVTGAPGFEVALNCTLICRRQDGVSSAI